MFTSLIQRFHKERLGLTMIVASVTVIVVIIALLFFNQNRQEVDNLREQGASIANIMAGIPFAQLTDRSTLHGPLKVLGLTLRRDTFAYALVVDADGRIANAVSGVGVTISGDLVPSTINSWAGERDVALPNGRRILEFFAPLVEDGELKGNVRVGYFLPSLVLAQEDVPLLATMALTIFLLTPLFYFLVRREVQPIHSANEEIAELINDGELKKFKVEASGEFQEFIGQFNRFVAIAQDRVEKLERDKNDLLTSQKLISYRKLRVEAVLKAVPEAIIILGENGRVSYANDKVTELLGVTPSEIMNKPPSEWCMIEDVLEFLSRFESPETSQYFSDTIRVADPKLLQKRLSLKAYPLFAPQSPETIFGRLIVLRDATKEAMAEDSRSNFVAHVAHELKSPLNTLALYSEALQGEQGRDPDFRVEAYNVIHDETERLAALIDNLLNITKIEMGSLKVDKQRVRLRDLLADAFKHVSHSGRDKNLEFKVELPPQLSPVAVDKDLLRIAVNNLLTNAVKYSRPGGTVSLSAEETDEAIRVRVADTGIGISPEDREKIFEKFYRAQNEATLSVGGHGLGLPLAKEIIELHRGNLSVESTPNEGSVFTIDLWKDGGLLQQAI